MIKIINKSRIISAAGTPSKKIEEFIGRIVSGTDIISIARMNSPPGWTEPWQLPDFDEFSVVLKGTLEIDTDEGHFKITEGMTVIAYKGYKIKYSTPDGAEYIAVCIPAFSSAAVHRENDEKLLSSSMLPDIEFKIKSYGPEGIDLIESNWILLREHIIDKIPLFADKMNKVTFQDRKSELLLKNKRRDIRIYIATSVNSGDNLGYCLSSAADGEYGEIESIYVKKDVRSHGIGTFLMQKSLNWIREKRIKEIRIHVTFGNEGVLDFYKKFGLVPRQYLLSNPE